MVPGRLELAARLAGIVREEDRTRPVTRRFNNEQAGLQRLPERRSTSFGFNYKPAAYGPFRAGNPTIPLFGSETASTVSSRGEYFFPVSETSATAAPTSR